MYNLYMFTTKFDDEIAEPETCMTSLVSYSHCSRIFFQKIKEWRQLCGFVLESDVRGNCGQNDC